MENETGPSHDYFLWRKGRLFAETAQRNMVKWIFDGIGFTLSIGLVLVGYTYGKDASQRILATASSNASKSPPKISVYPTRPVFPAETQNITVSCPSGFEFIDSHLLAFCLPSSFVKDSHSNTSIHFRSSDEEFMVRVGDIEQFPIAICNFEKEVNLAGNIATRTIFREETAAGCGDIVGFATTIYDTPKGNVQIHSWRISSSYSNENEYEKIERSLKL